MPGLRRYRGRNEDAPMHATTRRAYSCEFCMTVFAPLLAQADGTVGRLRVQLRAEVQPAWPTRGRTRWKLATGGCG